MKTQFILDCSQEYEFVVVAINSHVKGYKLCWNLNKTLSLNFEMTQEHKLSESLIFTRYKAETEEGRIYNLLPNRSKKGYLIPSQKSVNYFLVIKNEDWLDVKKEFMNSLRETKDVLLAYEADTDAIKNSDRFIIYDKKN